MTVSEPLRQAVIRRADNRCEYCLLSQLAQEACFHIDHVVPKSTGGSTTLDNLALACVSCSLRKGARQVVPDTVTGTEVPIFNPRREAWTTHFHWAAARLVGLTATGRATIEALHLNRPHVVAIREEERQRGRHPARLHL